MSSPGARHASRSLHLVAIALLTVAPLVAGATSFVPQQSDRTVLADALAATGLQFSSQINGDGAEGFLPFAESVAALAPTLDASAEASASQDSQILLDSVRGSGQADASVSTTGAADAFGSAAGDSFFQLLFSVDVETPVTLHARVSASALPPLGDTFAIVELVDADTQDILFSLTATDGEAFELMEMLTLVPGVNYELFASALAVSEAAGPGAATETASAQFSFSLVPEPGTLLLVMLGLGGMATAARPRRP